MSQNRASVVIALVAMLLGAGAALSQSRARVWGIVTDASGEPISDVTIQVIDEEEEVRAEQTTNKKGRYTVALLDATRPYVFRFEKEGYKTLEEMIKVSILSNTRRDFTLEEGRGTMVSGGDTPSRGGGGGPTAIYNEGVLAFESGDLELAKEKFREAIEKDQDFALGYSALARVLFRLEDWEGARQQAEKAIEFDAEDQVALSVLYQAYEKLGEEDKAKQTYEHLLSLADPDVAAYNLGVEAYQVGNLELAQEKFNEALGHNPDLVQAHVGLARIAVMEEDWAAAKAAAERALALEPENEGALTARYQAAVGLGDEAQVQSALEELKAVAPERLVQGYHERGVELFNDSKVEEAKELFEQVIAIDPDHARSHYMLGLTAVNAGDNAAAKEHFTRFLELTPEDPDAATAREMLKYLE